MHRVERHSANCGCSSLREAGDTGIPAGRTRLRAAWRTPPDAARRTADRRHEETADWGAVRHSDAALRGRDSGSLIQPLWRDFSRRTTSPERLKCANSGHSQSVRRTGQVDPKHAFKMGPMNGRKRRESSRRRYGQDAPGPTVAEPNCERVRSTRSSNGGQRDRGADPSQGHARHPTDAGGGRPLLSAETHAALEPQRPVPDGSSASSQSARRRTT